MKNYKETVNYLFDQFPQYQKIGKKAYKADLANITALCNLLGNPQKQLSFIHIAGTNGKGSVTHMLASILQEAGYRTGIFTSPHLIDFHERIKINGKNISKEYIIDFVSENKNGFKNISPSFFEWTTALAFYYFKAQKTDINIIETGLGGRLDSTNIIQPILSIITSIGLDHQNILGNTLAEIAREKGGIIKNDTPIVLGPQIIETISDFKKIAKQKNAPLLCAKTLALNTDLLGEYQQFNASTAYSAYQLLKDSYNLNDHHLKNGLTNVAKNTGIRGRWEILKKEPLIIADIGHNLQAFKGISQELCSIKFNKGYFIIGFSDDKEISEIIKLLPKNMDYIITQSNNPRAKKTKAVAKQMIDLSIHSIFNNSKDAYLHARSIAEIDDLIFIGGSAFLVADILSEFFTS